MLPKLSCRKCGSDIEANDAFCSKCGEKVEWNIPAKAAPAAGPVSSPQPARSSSGACSLCGHVNPAEAFTCAGCGATLRAKDPSIQSRPKKNAKQNSSSLSKSALSFFQSWKMTAGLGVLLIVALVLMRTNRQEPIPASQGMPPQHEEFVKAIQALQKTIDADPKNAEALLKLGNLYYDQRVYPRAIMMYDRYLEITPSDPNARVDLGVSYFELALQDSLHRDEYFASAKKEIENAIHYAPTHQLAYYNLGMVNLHTGDLDHADEMFTKCYRIDSTSETGRRAQQLIKKHITSKPQL